MESNCAEISQQRSSRASRRRRQPHRLDFHFWKRKIKHPSLIFLAVIFLHCFSHNFASASHSKSHSVPPERRQLIKSLLDELHEHELHHIFGKSVNPQVVPNHVDLISPVFTSSQSQSHRKIKRRKPETPVPHHKLQFHGFGRTFSLSLTPNSNLVHPNLFVHLVRRGNSSDILPETHIRDRLGCFYHGDVQHSKADDQDVKSGRVALDLCRGVAGFIVPSDNDPEHYYVIHPVPERLQRKSMAIHDNAHFIWKQPHNRNEISISTKGQKDKRVTSGGTDPHSATATCAHETHLRDEDDDEAGAERSVDDFLTAHDDIGHGDGDKRGSRARAKRSPIPSSFIDDGQFHYKPLSIASDSYWLRYRTTASPTVNDYQREIESSWITGTSASTRSSSGRSRGSGRRHRESGEDVSSSWSTVPHTNVQSKRDFVDRNNDHEWAKGVLVYESSRVVPTVAATEPYGGARKFSAQIPSYSEPDDTDDLKRATSTWLTGTRKHFPTESTGQGRYRHGNDSAYGYKSRWSSPTARSSSTGSGAGHQRKGRRDDSVFGDKWYTSAERLDPMSSMQNEMIVPPAPTVSINDNFLHHHEKEPSHLTIETAVFIDKDLFKHMQANFPEDTHGEVARIVLAMINAVQLLYQDPSLGHRVDFVLKRLEILESDPVGLLRPLDIDQFLTNFCKWQKLENPPNDAHFLHWDHALILTGLDLYVVHQSGKISNQVVGLAPVSGMCTRSSSCTVNEGRHFESVYVVAHEIGHNLGMRHDGVQADNDCDPTAHIMSPTLGSGKISWSPCSKRYLDMFLETSQSKCLLDKAKSESRLDHESDGRLPGERFNSDKQCVLKYGRGSFHAEQQPIEDVCRDLHCRKEHYTWTSHPALEGTFCGKEMWCRGGKCVPKLTNLLSSTENTGSGLLGSFFGNPDHHPANNHLDKSETAAYSASRPIEGGWGKWSPFTDCSSACLYTDDGLPSGSTGIRLAARRCDSPRPENGGLQCFGSDRRYKTCSTDKICPFETSKTTVTQYANEVCIRAATVDTELSGRGFMTKTNDPERACSVWCETTQRSGSRSRGWSFPDGTSCSLTSKPEAHSYCIAGKCQDFSCDSTSHFALSDEICASGAARHGRITKYDSSRSDYSVPKTWFHTSVSSSSISASSSVSSANNERDTGLGSKFSGSGGLGGFNNHENEIFGWTRWESHSDCKLSCLEPAKGLELVQRHCNMGENHCNGVALSVRLCKPSKTTIVANGCTRIQTPFEYATKICGKYSRKISGLSGLGMQLSPTKDDADRPCRIGCQDADLPYRFYMVNGEEGWFPSGTDCGRGELNKKAFCLSGKCIEFGQDDTPNYRMNSKLLARLDPGFGLRHKREVPTAQHLRHHSRRSHTQSQNYLDQNSLRDLVAQYSQANTRQRNPHRQLQNTSGAHAGSGSPNLDFNRPVVEMLPNADNNEPMAESSDLQPEQLQPLEGSFYEWRKIMSDCSVTCGSGIQEVIVQCISGDTVVNESLCPAGTRPGHSSYVNCTGVQARCPDPALLNVTLLWNWLESIRLSNSNISNS